MQGRWFKECEDSKEVTIFTEGGNRYVIYKGIKLERTNDGHRLLDVRYFDFYSRVSKRDKKVLKSLGFVKGCDTLMYQRDLMRVDKYEQDMKDFYKRKARLSKSLPKSKNKRLVRKKLNILDRKIHEVLDLVFFYKSRKEQFEIKYKLNR